jgi:spore coat polysaccharide biosynthesis protein SpsF
MSSRRFPGKVLAPFRGQPIIRHVVEAVARALPDVPRLVVTSTEPSDDPLAAYLANLNIDCFRGPLDDVFERFRAALRRHPATWVLRICADSPLLSAEMLRAVVAQAAEGVDLVTTTAPRTFQTGNNAELIRARTLLEIDAAALDAHDREHVTPFLHRHPRLTRVNVASGDPRLAELSVAVDSIDDLHRLEDQR